MLLQRLCVVTSTSSSVCQNQDVLLLGTGNKYWICTDFYHINTHYSLSDEGEIMKVVFGTNGDEYDPIIPERIAVSLFLFEDIFYLAETHACS